MTIVTTTVGDLAVHVVPEQELNHDAGTWLFPDLPPDVAQHPDLIPDHVEPAGALRLDSHSFALTVDGQRILIDTGIGNGKTRANPIWHDLDTPYLESLAAAGFPPDQVDLVVLTHLHTDHVGWNTRRDGEQWVPTFPNARYLTAHAEWTYWRSIELDTERSRLFDDSILPIRDAELLDTVEVGPEERHIAPGVRLLPAPGHTPGQVMVELRHGGETGLISGDAIHHPLQITHPDLVTRADIDPGATITTRRNLLARLADEGSLLLGTHFTAPTAGHVQRVAGAEHYQFVPVD
jgi:glyoxylase-like metal-dependent hydrolase (beta-lactamase superfamily II)